MNISIKAKSRSKSFTWLSRTICQSKIFIVYLLFKYKWWRRFGHTVITWSQIDIVGRYLPVRFYLFWPTVAPCMNSFKFPLTVQLNAFGISESKLLLDLSELELNLLQICGNQYLQYLCGKITVIVWRRTLSKAIAMSMSNDDFILSVQEVLGPFHIVSFFI